jgi:hypothetical protein
VHGRIPKLGVDPHTGKKEVEAVVTGRPLRGQQQLICNNKEEGNAGIARIVM